MAVSPLRLQNPHLVRVVNHVAGDGDKVGVQLRRLFQQDFVVLPELLAVEVGNLYDAVAVKPGRQAVRGDGNGLGLNPVLLVVKEQSPRQEHQDQHQKNPQSSVPGTGIPFCHGMPPECKNRALRRDFRSAARPPSQFRLNDIVYHALPPPRKKSRPNPDVCRDRVGFP